MDEDLLEAERELALVRAFVAQNAYPAYDTMCARMRRAPEVGGKYGEENHECCKAIYESGLDKVVTRTMGTKIYERGGMDALQACYYALKLFSPFVILPVGLRGMPNLVEFYWDGIGEWRC